MKSALRLCARFAWPSLAILALVSSIWGGLCWHRRELARQKVYRIGAEVLPPYSNIRPDGSFEGLSVDVVREAARRRGIRLEWIPINVPYEEALDTGLVDIWPAMMVTDLRRTRYHVSTPWLETSSFLIRLEGTHGTPRHVAWLARPATMGLGKRLFPQAVMIPVKKREEILQKVCSGEADLGWDDARGLNPVLLHRPKGCESAALALDPIPGSRKLAIISSRDAAWASDSLRSEISAMVADESINKLVEKWEALSSQDTKFVFALDAAEKRNQVFVYALAVTIIAGFLLILQTLRMREAKRVAEAASQAKGQFLANMSHELRTPMTGILGTSDLLAGMELPAEQRKMVETIQASGRALLTVVGDILDFSKIEAGKIELELVGFDLGAVLRGAADIVKPACHAKGLELTVDAASASGIYALGDPSRLRQVLLNLLSNAVKFTNAGTVRLGMDRLEERGGVLRVRFTVEDTGIGISQANLDLLFRSFTQVDASISRRFGGTGLGLAISQRIIGLMGGTIDVKSTPGIGSAFAFTLELHKAVPPKPEQEETSAQGVYELLRNAKILVADDNRVNQTLARMILEKAGSEVTLAKDGGEAVENALRTNFDLILMDCHMPVLDGYDATRRVREWERTHNRHTPVVALTASTFHEDRLRCKEAGMDDFVSKPFSSDELTSRCAAILANAGRVARSSSGQAPLLTL